MTQNVTHRSEYQNGGAYTDSYFNVYLFNENYSYIWKTFIRYFAKAPQFQFIVWNMMTWMPDVGIQCMAKNHIQLILWYVIT